MAYTAKEKNLISLLRIKMGDSPFLADSKGKLILDTDGNPQIDNTKTIWDDSEYLKEINSAMRLTFKGKKQSLEVLDDYEDELVLIQGQINLTMGLVLDAVRYVKYKSPGGVEVERPTTGQLLEVVKALRDSLKIQLEEGGNSDVGAQVVQSILRRYDKDLDMMMPSRYQPTPKFPPFTTVSKNGYVEVSIGYAFIDDFRCLILKKISDNTENVLETYTYLQDHLYRDINVVAGKIYTYRLYVQTINGQLFHIDSSVVYAG